MSAKSVGVRLFLVLAAGGLVVACGDDSEGPSGPVTPPELNERPLPVLGGPDDEEFEEPTPPEEFVPEDRVEGAGEGECCMVTFAYTRDFPEEIGTAVLRGSMYPLNSEEGIELTEADGVWSGEACLAPGEYGTYYYDVGLNTGSGELFMTIDYNPYVPKTEWQGEFVNVWTPADDCASLDLSIHAQTTPD